MQLSRRAFAELLTALAASPRLAWGGEAHGVSIAIARLADTWNETGKAYEATILAVFHEGAPQGRRRAYCDPDCPELLRYRSSRDRMLKATGALMLQPSRTTADLALKYHALETFFVTRVIWDEDVFIAAGGYQWYAIVEAEAEGLGVTINSFWRWGAKGLARLGGPDPWVGVGRWRTAEYLEQARQHSA